MLTFGNIDDTIRVKKIEYITSKITWNNIYNEAKRYMFVKEYEKEKEMVSSFEDDVRRRNDISMKEKDKLIKLYKKESLNELITKYVVPKMSDDYIKSINIHIKPDKKL
jgi:hypothetical protein